MNIKLKTPKAGYKVEIKLVNPIWEIKRAKNRTINIPFLKAGLSK